MVESVNANYKDRFDEIRRHWGGGRMSQRSQARQNKLDVETGVDDPNVVALAKQAYDEALLVDGWRILKSFENSSATIAARATIMKALTKSKTLTSAIMDALNECRNKHQLQDIVSSLLSRKRARVFSSTHP